MPELSEWDSFFVIVASSAGALIGLQFVVLTLIAARPRKRVAEAGAAFSTPTIVHFSTVLLVSAISRAPWPTISSIAVIWGVIGFGGIVYTLIVTRRVKRQPAYKPDFEDWLCHVALPMVAYCALTLSSFAAYTHSREALFGIGMSTLLLLFIGIHNTWDSISYHVFFSLPKDANDTPMPGKGERDD